MIQGGIIQEGAAQFEPFFPALVVLLPLLGFALNGFLALKHARLSADAVRAGGELDLDGPSGRPATHTLPSLIGPGVMLGAFIITLINFVAMMGVELHDPVVIEYWTWMATGTFSVGAALQLDQLSMIMMLIITGVGFLIHVFSVGYMKD
ncbi:MAG: hypothetical protein WD031_00535, partial [Gemmatimonadota bacterium]